VDINAFVILRQSAARSSLMVEQLSDRSRRGCVSTFSVAEKRSCGDHAVADRL